MAKAAAMFLPKDSWESHHKLSYDIHLELAVNHYLNKNSDESESLFEECIAHASDIYEKVRVYEQRTFFTNEKMLYQDTISSGLECLALLGVHIPPRPSDEYVIDGIHISLLYIFIYRNC